MALDIHFSTSAPWTLLFGPSGSGKSTILRMVAGFVAPDRGAVLFGPLKSILLDTAKRIDLPPHLRPVRTAPQAPRLIPHRRVLANIRYGLSRGTPAGYARELDEVLAMFRLHTSADRHPAELSGGEIQRVSVARAVLAAATYSGPERALLLLDEPFTGLDSALRDELATDLREWQRRRQIPVLSVSHSVAEAFLLDAEVIRLGKGRIVEQGPAREVLASERRRLLQHLGGA